MASPVPQPSVVKSLATCVVTVLGGALAGAYSYLGSHRVTVTWSSPEYRYTHQKTVIIDGAEAVIMTANLASRYYATSRDFLMIDTERADVSAITAVFDADLTGQAIRRGDGSHLVWSPTDFSSTSLNQNRELGLIISSHPVMSAVASTFAADFRNGRRWS